MSYVGFGIQSMNSFRRPRQAFKPIFEQLSNGEHPIESNNQSFFKTWKETQLPNEREQLVEKVRANYIYLFLTIGILAATIVAML